MAFEELDDLLNTLAEADRGPARDLLTRNPNFATQLNSQQTVYRAFVDGDPVRMAAATAPVTPPVATTASTAATTPTPATTATSTTPPAMIGLDQLNTLLTERLSSVYSSPQFTAAVEAKAKEIATASLAAERNNIIGVGAEVADQLYSIRATHAREFQEELDSAKFKEFFQANGPKFSNQLLPAYDAYVSDRRIQAKIDKGIADGLAARATSDVPGGAIPTTNNPIGPNFVDYQTRRVGTTAVTPEQAAAVVSQAPGTPAPPPVSDVEAAAQAFRAMQANWKM